MTSSNMDDFTYASVFAEDLMVYLTKRLNIPWHPLTTAHKFRVMCSRSEFRDKIGDVVSYMYGVYSINPEDPSERDIKNMGEANKYLSEKFFRFGNDFFNLMDYCAQLAWFATNYFRESEIGAIDVCVIYIASTISKFIVDFKSRDVLKRFYWNELRRVADKIVLPGIIYPILIPMHQPLLLPGVNTYREVQQVL